eukprot:200671_1
MDQDEESFSAKVIIPLILLLQTIFYLVVLFFFTVLGVDGNSVGLLFDPQQFNSNSGNAVIVSFSIASIPCAFLVTWIVKQAQRSHKCLDYVSAIYILHFLLCWILYRFPWNWMWWIGNIMSFALMSGLSEYGFNRKSIVYHRLDHEIHSFVT